MAKRHLMGFSVANATDIMIVLEKLDAR